MGSLQVTPTDLEGRIASQSIGSNGHAPDLTQLFSSEFAPFTQAKAFELLSTPAGRTRFATEPYFQAAISLALFKTFSVVVPVLAEELGAHPNNSLSADDFNNIFPRAVLSYRPYEGSVAFFLCNYMAEALVKEQAQSSSKSIERGKKVPPKKQVNPQASDEETQFSKLVGDLSGLDRLIDDLGKDIPPESQITGPNEEETDLGAVTFPDLSYIEVSALPPIEERFKEYAWKPYTYATEELNARDRLALRLYLFKKFEISDLALIFGIGEEQMTKTMDTLLASVARNMRALSFVGGEVEGRAIEAKDLGLNESNGMTLLKIMLRDEPDLRKTPKLLELCADSTRFFEDLAASTDPSVIEFRALFYSRGKPLNVKSFSTLFRNLFHNWAKSLVPDLDHPNYNAALAQTLGLPPKASKKTRTLISPGRFNDLARELINAGIYPAVAKAKNPLTIVYRKDHGALHLRHPLLENSVVGDTQARANIRTVLRGLIPNLDAANKEQPYINSIRSLLGLPVSAPIMEVRKALLAQGHLEPDLPEDYSPTFGDCSYFNCEYLTPEQLKKNQDELIRRRWSNLDDVEENPLMATACGVPNRITQLVARAIEVFGTEIPTGHPLDYLPREMTRYLNPKHISDPAQLNRNFEKAIKERFNSIDQFTKEGLDRANCSLKRLAVIFGTDDNFDSLARTAVQRGILPGKRPAGAPSHRDNGKLSYYFYASAVGKAQAEQNLLDYLDERFGIGNKVPVDHVLTRMVRIASAEELKPVFKGSTFERALNLLRHRHARTT